MEIIALQEYTDKHISIYQGEVRNISDELAAELIEKGIVAQHDETIAANGYKIKIERESLYNKDFATTIKSEAYAEYSPTNVEISSEILASIIELDSLDIEYNGKLYTNLNKKSAYGPGIYRFGAPIENYSLSLEERFSEYPFSIVLNSSKFYFYTKEPENCSIKIYKREEIITISQDFKKAVNSIITSDDSSDESDDSNLNSGIVFVNFVINGDEISYEPEQTLRFNDIIQYIQNGQTVVAKIGQTSAGQGVYLSYYYGYMTFSSFASGITFFVHGISKNLFVNTSDNIIVYGDEDE